MRTETGTLGKSCESTIVASMEPSSDEDGDVPVNRLRVPKNHQCFNGAVLR